MKLMKLWNRNTERARSVESLMASARQDPPAVAPEAAQRVFERALAEFRASQPDPAPRRTTARPAFLRPAFAAAACAAVAILWFSRNGQTPSVPNNMFVQKPVVTAQLPGKTNAVKATGVRPTVPPAPAIRNASLPSRPRIHRHGRTVNRDVLLAHRFIPATGHRHWPPVPLPYAPKKATTSDAPPVQTELAQVLVVTATNTEPAVRVEESAPDAPGSSRVAVYTPDGEGGGLISECRIAQDQGGASTESWAITTAAMDRPNDDQPYLRVEAETPASAGAIPDTSGLQQETKPDTSGSQEEKQ